MATIINADIDGLVEKADESGVLHIQTKGVTAITVSDTQRVVIGDGKLSIQGGTSGQVLTTDGSGNLTWQNTAATQVNSDWNATTGVSSILNKPVLGTSASTDSSSYAPAIHT